MPKTPGREEPDSSDDHAAERRREFEAARGLTDDDASAPDEDESQSPPGPTQPRPSAKEE